MARKHKGSVRRSFTVAAYKFPTPAQIPGLVPVLPAHMLSAHADDKGLVIRSKARGGAVRQTTVAW